MVVGVRVEVCIMYALVSISEVVRLSRPLFKLESRYGFLFCVGIGLIVVGNGSGFGCTHVHGNLRTHALTRSAAADQTATHRYRRRPHFGTGMQVCGECTRALSRVWVDAGTN